jgi:hypothetical protein
MGQWDGAHRETPLVRESGDARTAFLDWSKFATWSSLLPPPSASALVPWRRVSP